LKLLARSLSLAALLGIASAANAQLTFNFEFDGTPDATITPPIVGTGTLTLAADPGNGTFAFNAISPTLSFLVNGESFSNADILTPTANVQVQISTSGPDRIVNFAGFGGPFGGSLDLINANARPLSFQPGFGTLYFDQNSFGTYRGTAASTQVPEPGSVALLVGAGIGGLMIRRRRK
jgi:hypothetical protein